MKHEKKSKQKGKGKKDHPAVKGLKSASTHSGQALHKEYPRMKPKELTDPTLGLKNAIKLKGVEALALKAAGI